jgi:hypothetical protein
MAKFTPRAALPPGEEALSPLNTRLGGLQSGPGRFIEAKNLLHLWGIETRIA